MKKHLKMLDGHFSRFLVGRSNFYAGFYAGILLILILALFPACASRKLSLEEAEKVVLSMDKKSFVPPARRIDDILAVLDQPGQFDPGITLKIKAKADAAPPETDDRLALANFYSERGRMAGQLGRYAQALKDLRTALSCAENQTGRKVEEMSARSYAGLLIHLGSLEKNAGNFRRGMELIQQGFGVFPGCASGSRLMESYVETGDLKAAQEAKDTANRICNQEIEKRNRQIQRGKGEPPWKQLYNNYLLEVRLLAAKGRFSEAEPFIRLMIDASYQAYKTGKETAATKDSIRAKALLAGNLAKQERLVEAEIEVRDALKGAIGYAGEDSELVADILQRFAFILLKQGRYNEAEKLSYALIDIYRASGLMDDTKKLAGARFFLGRISAFKGDFAEAMQHYDFVEKSLRDNHYLYETKFARNPNLMLSLLKTGRVEEAMKLISFAYALSKESFGEKDFQTAHLLGLRAMANAMMKNHKQALEDFSNAVPILIEKNNDGLEKGLRVILEAYMELLTEIRGSRLENDFRIDASAEAFRLADVIFGSSLQDAIGATGARAAAVTPELADLVRKEQDALQQIETLKATLSDTVAVPPDQQNPQTIGDLKSAISSLSNARTTLFDEIKKRFPKYSDLLSPQLATVAQVQSLLRPTEVLIVIYPVRDRTYVWAIPPEGRFQFASVPLGKGKIKRMVSRLREALAPNPTTLRDIPEFDLGLAYDLYGKLLGSVEEGWKNAKDLLVVAKGELGQLSFAVLPTASVKLSEGQRELFDNYRNVPWLIRKVSIARLPSVSSLLTLRKLPEGPPGRKAFAGFGDPLYNPKQLAQAESEKNRPVAKIADKEEELYVRGLRITEKGDLDSKTISSISLDDLNRLPDTAEEIRHIADALGADLTQDIFLGKNATERRVKTMDLSNRRVITFASHALVPGDLDGLDQPAIALSSPSITGDDEDGLLTMGEILRLKLNADWIVLSACNTGAADGAGEEAFSGLGRAFFYAGSRAILASMWPVETTSAMKLTTGLFRYQQEEKNLWRARALQKSMLDLIEGPGLKDKATGKVVASYAHPFFWAPFIVVGDNR